MGMVAILVKWPKTNIEFILFYLLKTPYEIWVQTAQWFLKKWCLDMHVAVQNERSAVSLTFGAYQYIKLVFH